MGDLSTDIFALGLNREITYSTQAIPFFLAECRRKTYVSAYYLDKIFAMVLNRPPRISARHADCRMPLDLSPKDIFVSSDEDIQKSHSKVTSDGWDMDLKYRSTTWARLRYILAVFREEMIEFQISSVRPVDELKLRWVHPLHSHTGSLLTLKKGFFATLCPDLGLFTSPCKI